MQPGDSLTDISGYCQQDCGCKMIRAGGCLILLASNTFHNHRLFSLTVTRATMHSVVKATNLYIATLVFTYI